jgi:2-C-methyl-D-erythritol 4-phosphate cytidylyltransferase/2-C-methyl-D-erythritol 2,4-cyclodiphosphate synthase
VSALIPAAGKGRRFGSSTNKVFAEVFGKPIIAYTLAAFQACRMIDEIILVVGKADILVVEQIVREHGPFDKLSAIVPGGDERGDSVRAGLSHVHGDIVAIHDGARPLISEEVIVSTVEAARTFGAAVAAVPVVDTIKQANSDGIVTATPDRSNLYQIQTPQTFRTADIRKAYDWAQTNGVFATDDSALYEKVVGKVKLVPGSYDNIKVTGPQDVTIVECRLQNRNLNASLSGEGEDLSVEASAKTDEGNTILDTQFRTGFGYDVHRLVPGRRLVLGGVEFDSPVGLLGHSDADVILHAISDALLGAEALGDIGKLFPDTDSFYKDIDSLILLKKVAELLDSEGWAVVNVDAMMIGERPKISPKSDEMRENIAGAIGVSISSISIKATTSEGLGYIGSGEGICCYAIATIHRKRGSMPATS